MEIYKPGTIVRIRYYWNSEIKAQVVAVKISDNNQVDYLVSWWDDRTRHEQWLSKNEVRYKYNETKKAQIGFHNAPDP